MRYLRTEKLRSFHLRPFIVLTITKRAHYKAERVRVRVPAQDHGEVGVRVRVRVRWGLGCLNIENNPRWVVSPPGPTLL